jgi:phage shock protein C
VKRLYRSRTDRMLAGVAGGIAEYLAVDPTLVRVVFVVLALAGSGIGLLVYLVLWLIVPEEGSAAGSAGSIIVRAGDRAEARVIVGVVLIALGILYLLRNLGFPWAFWLDGRIVWPAIIMVVGLLLLLRGGRRH